MRAVNYLDPGKYWGSDLNQSLLMAGYEKEIVPAGLAAKLPRQNLVTDGEFTFDGLPHAFDFAIAQSLFTHLPFNHIRLCLTNLAKHVESACDFYATFFIAPDGSLTKTCLHEPGDITTFPHKDPFHYSVDDLHYLTSGLPWTAKYIGDWNHPRSQKMVLFSKPATTLEAPSTRNLSIEQAGKLPAGADHYRAYVGPAGRFDFMSSSQFALLFALGIREHHKVLDFGCGSLRLGRLLIPFLREGGYFGIDPNAWLIEEALDRELGRGIVDIKKPIFAYNDDFSTKVFSEKFDFTMAQSILTHTGPGTLRTFIRSAAETLSENGLLLFSYVRDPNQDCPLPNDGWYYPECVRYSESWILEEVHAAGLHGLPLPWYHPGAVWMAASRTPSGLPNAENLDLLKGAVLREPQFTASIK